MRESTPDRIGRIKQVDTARAAMKQGSAYPDRNNGRMMANEPKAADEEQVVAP